MKDILSELDNNSELSFELENFWNNNTISYNLDEFPFVKWLEDRIFFHGYDIPDLTKLHEVVPVEESAGLAKKLIQDTNHKDFRELAYNFANKILIPNGNLKGEIAIQRFFNVNSNRRFSW